MACPVAREHKVGDGRRLARPVGSVWEGSLRKRLGSVAWLGRKSEARQVRKEGTGRRPPDQQEKRKAENTQRRERKEKDEDMALWEELLKQARFNDPGASEQKLHALVYKQI